MKKIRIGIVGYGGISQGVHVPGYLACPDNAEITALCDINPEKLKAAKEKLNLPDSALFTDYKEMINSGLIDAIDICTPNHMHCPIASAAIDAGLPFSTEKPMGLSYAEAKALYDKAEKAGSKSFICFSWRYRPYTRYVRDIIKSGEIGKIYHIYISYIKDSGLWEGRKLEWRFDKDRAGTGVLGDLGSHMIDIARFWGEEFKGVFAQTGTYITERPTEDTGEIKKVTTDDWCNITGMTESDIPVTISLSRTATGFDDRITFEVFGENGRLRYSWIAGKQDIEICTGKEDVKSRTVRHLVPPAGYEANQSLYFVNMINGIEDEFTAHLEHGIACQKVLEAAEKSAKEGRYVNIDEIR